MSLPPASWQRWALAIVVVAFIGWNLWRMNERPAADDIVAQSDFGAQFWRTRELLDHFSNCNDPGRTNATAGERAQANAAYARMRKTIQASAFDRQARIIDRQVQLLMEPYPHHAIARYDTCQRLAFLAPVTLDQVLASIAATERVAAR